MITSVRNDLVKYYVKLMTSKKERDKEGLFVVEGEHLVEEAIKANVVEEVMISDLKYENQFNVNYKYISNEVMNKICDTKTPQGVIALCRQQEAVIKNFNRLILLDNIQDPGNLGTIIRTSDAFNFDGIIVNLSTVDIYNPKVIRSTQGAIFRKPIIKVDLKSYFSVLRNNNVLIYGTSLFGEPLSNIESSEKMAFILGNEGNGVSKELLDVTDKNIYIEMNGMSESLNVGVASAIIMYKFRK